MGEPQHKLDCRATLVVIPVLNPEQGFESLVDTMAAMGFAVLVVDDGSDKSAGWLWNAVAMRATVLRHGCNQGKGAALKTAFAYADAYIDGISVVVTMDGDGQHSAADVLRVAQAAWENIGVFVLGARQPTGKVPLRSRLGNAAARHLFRLATSVDLVDTQTGLRAFGAWMLPFLASVEGNGFDYETNVLLRCCSEGMPLLQVPVAGIYEGGQNPTSHFRSIADSVAIANVLISYAASHDSRRSRASRHSGRHQKPALRTEYRSNRRRRRALAVLVDMVLAVSIVGGYYVLNYAMPQNLGTGQMLEASVMSGASQQASANNPLADSSGGMFTDKVVSTDTEYHSPNVSITLSQVSYDAGIFGGGSDATIAQYGSRVAYTLADIYVKDASSIRTAFAQNTYGVGYTELLASMSKRMKSAVAVNGDSYSNNRHADNGTIVRNGAIYRSKSSTDETCVLYRDGTMKVLPPGPIDANQLAIDGAWQSWVFGPSLLDENGGAKTQFLTWDYIAKSHPRTAVGYYGPGHYCLLVVDGRTAGYSRGMYLSEMSKLFSSLGCKLAYNLDGGHCSSMTKGQTVISKPYRPSKQVSDGIFICEPGGAA